MPLNARPNGVFTQTLTKRIIAGIEGQFSLSEHQPAPAHWKGLRAIAETVVAMVFGQAKDKFYLSSLPTGMGKTTALAETVKVLAAEPSCTDVGFLILVNQLDLIEPLIERMGFNLGIDSRYAVRTSDRRLNRLGVGTDKRTSRQRKRTIGGSPNPDYLLAPHRTAQVLITTQQKLLRMTRCPWNKDFEDNTFYHFKGKRRVGVWDEAICPIHPITIAVPQIKHFVVELEEKGFPGPAAKLQRWANKLPNLAKDWTTVPQWWPDLEMRWEAPGNSEEKSEEYASIGWALKRLNGSPVHILRDEYSGATAISYDEVLPDEFAPLLVLDANGQGRVSYQLWSKYRQDLVFLPSASKTYHNLTIHHLNLPAGKAAHRDEEKRGELVQAGTAAFFQVPPHESMLAIVRKAEKPHQDMETLLGEAILDGGGDPDRLRCVTWGRHTGTNEFKDCKHLFVDGLLQAPPAHYHALYRGVCIVPPAIPANEALIENLRLSEVEHELLQAVGRGAVRLTVGGDVPRHCHLWIAFSTKGPMGITPLLLERAFPGATIVDWNPLPPQLTGRGLKTKDRETYFQALLAKHGEWFEAKDFEPTFSRQKVWRYLTQDETFRSYLEAQGLEVHRTGGPMRRGGKVCLYRIVQSRQAAA